MNRDEQGIDRAQAEVEGRLITLRYEGESVMSAAELADALQGLVALVNEVGQAGLLGDGPPPEVLVEPPKEGSFEITAILAWAMAHPDQAVAVGTSLGGNVVMGFKWIKQLLRDDLKDFDYVSPDEVKVIWKDDSVDVVPHSAWKEFSKLKKKTKKAMEQILRPTSKGRDVVIWSDPDGAAGPEKAVVARASVDDYRAALPQRSTNVTVERFEVEAHVRAVDFDPDRNWRIRTSGGSRSVPMEDVQFRNRIKGGLAIRETDIFRFRIRAETTKNDGRSRTKWAIEEVLSHRRGHDDDDASRGTGAGD